MLDFPIGTIIFWENTTIPSGWQICNGTGGTPNLVDKFVAGASVDGDVGYSAGASTHTHTTPSTSSRSAHNHGGSVNDSLAGGTSIDQTTGTGETPATVGHTHTANAAVTAADVHSHTGGTTGSGSNLPTYITRVYIQRIS